MTPGILTTCASCAVPIPYTAPRCSKCHTRYCGQACQARHWNTGGHNRALCKRIKRAGGAEKYHADQKYNEAVAEAVETCSAHVPEGATCYICTEAVVQRTGEGLVVEYCACGDRDGVDAGSTGIAHVSCLVREAELAQVDEMSSSWASWQDRWRRWDTCRLCGRRYHGDVQRAMGWACWRANSSLSPRDDIRRSALDLLAGSLASNDRQEDALAIQMAALDIVQHHNAHLRTANPDIPYHLAVGCMCLQSNIASTLSVLGRHDEAIDRHRMIIRARDELFAESNAANLLRPDRSQISRLERVDVAQTYAKDKFQSILNLSTALINREPRSTEFLHEARSLLRDNMAEALRVLGATSEGALLWRGSYARTIYYDEGASDDDIAEANAIADDIESIARQHLGEYHPLTGMFERLGYDSDSEHSDSESTVDGGAPPEPDADHDVARTMQDEINVDDARGRPEFN